MKTENLHRTTDERDIVLEIKNLSIAFGDNQVLKDFNLTMRRGENIAVLGRSGSGKSVLIKCIIGLLKPDSGSIEVMGQKVLDLSSTEMNLLRMRMGFLFQSNALYDSMTVEENLLFPLRRHGIKKTKEELEDLITEALTNVELPHTRQMMPSELSGGMKKRIALARALILKPDIILYDEPTTGLDPITSKGISKLIVTLQKKYNASSLVISHDLNSIKIIANKVALLIDGKCYAFETFEGLKTAEDPIIKSFFEV